MALAGLKSRYQQGLTYIYTHTQLTLYIKWITNEILLYSSLLCDELGGKEIQKRGVCVYTYSDLFCLIVENNTAL